jgi:hypothetical protein
MLASVPSQKYLTLLWPMFISRPVSRGSAGVWSSPRLVVSRSVPTMPSRRAQAMSGHHLLLVVLAGSGVTALRGTHPPGLNRATSDLISGIVPGSLTVRRLGWA